MNACKLVGLLLLLLWGHTALYAQQVRTVRGRVQTVEAGSNEKRALPSASIVILAKSDSAFIKGITSDKNGRFILNYQPQKKKIRNLWNYICIKMHWKSKKLRVIFG